MVALNEDDEHLRNCCKPPIKTFQQLLALVKPKIIKMYTQFRLANPG